VSVFSDQIYGSRLWGAVYRSLFHLYVFFRVMLRIEQSLFWGVLFAVGGYYQQRIEIKALSSSVFTWTGNRFDLSVFIIWSATDTR